MKNILHGLAGERRQWLGLCLVVGTVLFYNLLFSFSFFPLTEGWFSAYAKLILQGKVPYKDFYLYLTPFYSLLLSGFIFIFGDAYFDLRVFGVLIIMCIAVLLYKILSRCFSYAASTYATVVAMVYYQSGVAHITYDFTQVLTLWTLVCTSLLISANESVGRRLGRRPRAAGIYLFFAGGAASLAFLTKQSNGAFVVAAAAIVCLVLCVGKAPRDWIGVITFCAGGILPAVVIFLWLAANGAVSAFFDQIFFGAMEAKGSGRQIFFSWMAGVFNDIFLAQMKTVCFWTSVLIFSSLGLRLLFSFFKNGFLQAFNGLVSFLLLVSGALAIGLAYVGDSPHIASLVSFGSQINNYVIPVSVTVAVAFFACGLPYSLVSSTAHGKLETLLIVCAMAIGMIFGNGTSAGLSEIGVFTSFAVVLAALTSWTGFRYVGWLVGLTLGAALIFTFATKKFAMPYAWWGAKEPSVHLAAYKAGAPIFAGLHISLATAKNLDEISSALSSATAAGDIFAFPNIPVIYLLSNRWPHSKVVVPWFDFLPDAPARNEALRLLAAPPAVIVNYRIPETAWAAHERLFRGGAPVGQRNIQKAIVALTVEQNLYSLRYTKEISEGSVIDIWYRRD